MSNLRRSIKDIVDRFRDSVLSLSLKKAAREQNLSELVAKIESAVPDITNQYSCFKIEKPLTRVKVRCQHSFQISMVNRVIEEYETPVIVDIGDSSGVHLQYLKALHAEKKIKSVSVNMDAEAIDKIKAKGLEAVHARAEDVEDYNINPDIFMCFQTMEHLMDPCKFLYNLSSQTKVDYIVITVPYRRSSRVGLYHIRNNSDNEVCSENTHIFELSPEDWKLLAMHSGWDVYDESIYLQYPRKSVLRLTKSYWKKSDFEGFYGLILKRNSARSSQYLDW